MFDLTGRHRTRLAALMITLAAVSAACNEDPTDEDDPAEEVDRVSLLIGGTQTVTINEAGVVTGGPIDVPLGTTRTVVATWLRSDNSVVTGLGSDFELRMVPSSTAIVTFAKTAQFGGTLTAGAAGTTNVEVELFHTGEGHADFEKVVQVRVP